MTLTATQLATAATGLATLRDALQRWYEDLQSVDDGADRGLGLIERSWRGPLPTELNGAFRTYLETVAGAPGAVDSARGTIDGWATAASDAGDELRRLESSRASLSDGFRTDIDIQVQIDRLNGVQQDIDAVEEAWNLTCVNTGAELQTAIDQLQKCAVANYGTVEQRTALMGSGYFVALATFATMTDTPFDLLDPTGELAAEGERRMAALSDDERAALIYAVIETMDQADIEAMDGKSSGDDWSLATDIDIVRFRLEITARLAGIELTDAELDALAGEIVVLAMFGQGVDGDVRDAVDDQFDEHGGIEAAIEAGGDTEDDWDLPDEPTETEQYIEAWLEAERNNDPGIIDYVAMFVVPDFSVMNPFSEDFHVGWALVEVVGIIPWGKVTKFARLARLGGMSDEIADATRLLDPAADLFGDGARVGDDVIAVGTDAGRAADAVPTTPPPTVSQSLDVSAADWNHPRTSFASRTDLEPETVYHVEGRGSFFTDSNGQVVHVETTYGDSSLNWDLHNAQPNTTYVVHPDVNDPISGFDYTHVFETDELGRTVSASTDNLSLGDARRSESVQSSVGSEGGVDYDGGHLFGNQFGGGAESGNLVAMLRSVNQSGPGSFYELETHWRTLVTGPDPAQVSVRIEPVYDGATSVPTEIVVEWTENGVPFRETFENL